MERRVKAPLAAWASCALALALLALIAYGIDAAQRTDASLRERFIARGDSGLDSLANVIVHLGAPLPLLLMLALACAVALSRGRPLDAAAAATVVLGANVTTQLLKVVLSHPRFQSAVGAEQLGEVPFPSGHVTAVTSIAIAFAFVVPRDLRPAVALLGSGAVLAVGCSVMVLSWHYPSDVLGGILVASGWGFAVLAGRRAASGGGSPRRPQVSSRAAISVK
ncbi:MAG TPA: phosphatase PAP2 family protein [Solirubrobacterales bacterium]|nr:phosphatase PAP2 family protein [Solirubrobacterales bacterium]